MKKSSTVKLKSIAGRMREARALIEELRTDDFEAAELFEQHVYDQVHDALCAPIEIVNGIESAAEGVIFDIEDDEIPNA